MAARLLQDRVQHAQQWRWGQMAAALRWWSDATHWIISAWNIRSTVTVVRPAATACWMLASTLTTCDENQFSANSLFALMRPKGDGSLEPYLSKPAQLALHGRGPHGSKGCLNPMKPDPK